ncbi:MAG: hypothetical protein BKP49_09105 [Treponema sp. CETP13]|nr:MAG: hypothetical protein BKP49_09105 [Treponema sp. CETP13]
MPIKKSLLFTKKSIRYVFFIILLTFIFTSCISNGKFYTFGEYQKYKNNIGVEYYNIASEYEKQKDYKNAVSFYQKCLDYDILTENELRYKIALNSAKAKDWDVAIENYEFLLQQDKNNKIINKSLAYVYASNNNLEKAIKIYEEILSTDNLDEDCISNYIYVLIANKNSEKAISVFEDFKKSFPESTEIETLQKLVYPDEDKNEKQVEALDSTKINEESKQD